jgi:hypothetical protein
VKKLALNVDNLAALELKLSTDHLRQLDEVSAISLGFPHDLVSEKSTVDRLTGGKLELFDRPAVVVR